MTQAQALDILKTGANIFLTGEPGSGKTYTINSYVSYLRTHGIEPAITASTGIAATHIGGMTIHSWSGIGVKSVINKYDLEMIEGKERVVRRVSNASVLIIDEISMLSAETLTSVELVCRHIRRRNEPFGGLQVVLVGDFFQLPPVVRREIPSGNNQGALDFYPDTDPDDMPGTPFAFRSPAWDEAAFLVCYLSEQHRQDDDAYFLALSAIRAGEVGSDVRERLTKRAIKSPAGITKLFPHNANVDKLNEFELRKLPGTAHTFRMVSRGAPMLVEGMKKSCLSPEMLVLKMGAKVMFTKNDPDGAYVNGTTGEVVGFGKAGSPTVQTRAGKMIEVSAVDWTVRDGETVLAKLTQFPLRLAWAMTVHKSQGMSLDAAQIDLAHAFEYGQGYVALSRVRSIDGLYLAAFNARALEVHPEVREQDGIFRVQSEAAEVQFGKMESLSLTDMQHNFIRACGGSIEAFFSGDAPAPKVKEKKPPTADVTRELILRPLSVAAAAKERDVTEGTIIGHLETLIADKKLDPKKDLSHIFSEYQQSFGKVHDAMRKTDSSHLKPVFEYLAGDVPYETIRLARLFFEA
jgi:ATP-dependent DNA helicase PIF1